MNVVYLCFSELCGIIFVNELHSQVHCSLENVAKVVILWALCFWKIWRKNFSGSHPTARRSGAPYPRHPFASALYIHAIKWLRVCGVRDSSVTRFLRLVFNSKLFHRYKQLIIKWLKRTTIVPRKYLTRRNTKLILFYKYIHLKFTPRILPLSLYYVVYAALFRVWLFDFGLGVNWRNTRKLWCLLACAMLLTDSEKSRNFASNKRG